MVRMLLGLLELSFFLAAAQKLQLKEKLISLKGFLMQLLLASSFCIALCFSITVLVVLKLLSPPDKHLLFSRTKTI